MLTPIRRARPICLWCHRRPALARVGKTWRVVKHHDVCRQCWRTFMDSSKAANLVEQRDYRRRAA